MHNKLNELKRILRECGRVTVAFSSGVDSTFLLKVASDTLPKENVLAVVITSEFSPKKELDEAVSFCSKENIKCVQIEGHPLSSEDVSKNPKDRCYHCKKLMFSKIKDLDEAKGSVVLEGSNVDDLSDYRPGMKAVKELSIRSPLMEAGLTKAEIRALSKELNLKTWDKPSAACLASRVAYGERLTKDKLEKVEKAEDILHENGFKQVRVRFHENNGSSIARIELMQSDIVRFLELQNEDSIAEKIKNLGFTYVTIDCFGYRMGSMNEAIDTN